MNILYIGDIMGEPGVEAVAKILPDIKKQYGVDLTIAQAENVSEGRGVTVADYQQLREVGIDFFTGGNWSLYRDDILPALQDPAQPIIRPANYPAGTKGLGHKFIDTSKGKVLVISLLGQIVGKDAARPVDNPLHVVDRILQEMKDITPAATIVNLHGDYSSEKVMIGYYLDGRVTAAVGDHWHVPTADAKVLPKGTAHITDVGMCGTLHSSLGVKFSSTITRWHDGVPTKNELETEGPRQFNAVLIKTDDSGLALSIEQLQRIYQA